MEELIFWLSIIFTEPLRGFRRVDVSQRRTRMDWAEQVRILLEEDYPNAPKVCLVMDNLNTHSIASLYAIHGRLISYTHMAPEEHVEEK